MMYNRRLCHYYDGKCSDLHVCANIFFKMASTSPNVAWKNGTRLFFTKNMSKNNLKPKYQFQQENPTGAPKSDIVAPTKMYFKLFLCVLHT